MFAGRPGSRPAGRRRDHRARVHVQLADGHDGVDGRPRRHDDEVVVAGGQRVRVHVHVHAAPEPERRVPRRNLAAAVRFRSHLRRVRGRRWRRRRQRQQRGLRRRGLCGCGRRRARHPAGNVLRRVHAFVVVGRPVQLPAAGRADATPVVHMTHGVRFRFRCRGWQRRCRCRCRWCRRRLRTRSSVHTVVRLRAAAARRRRDTRDTHVTYRGSGLFYNYPLPQNSAKRWLLRRNAIIVRTRAGARRPRGACTYRVDRIDSMCKRERCGASAVYTP